MDGSNIPTTHYVDQGQSYTSTNLTRVPHNPFTTDEEDLLPYTVAEEGQATPQPGDCNGDGGLNILDVVILVNYITGYSSLDTLQENLIAAGWNTITQQQVLDILDLSGDGIINILDIVAMVNEIQN